eukprot:scaffold4502_cov119-Isochrysis_galbana.AAC.3
MVQKKKEALRPACPGHRRKLLGVRAQLGQDVRRRVQRVRARERLVDLRARSDATEHQQCRHSPLVAKHDVGRQPVPYDQRAAGIHTVAVRDELKQGVGRLAQIEPTARRLEAARDGFGHRAIAHCAELEG